MQPRPIIQDQDLLFRSRLSFFQWPGFRVAHEIEVNGAPFRGVYTQNDSRIGLWVYLKFMSTCYLWICGNSS